MTMTFDALIFNRLLTLFSSDEYDEEGYPIDKSWDEDNLDEEEDELDLFDGEEEDEEDGDWE